MHRPCKTLIATAVLSLFSGSIAAQDAKKESSLPAITVTGTSILPSSIENLPGSYSVMTREQIEARSPFSIIETIREIPGLHVVAEDVAGTHLNIGLRGLNPRRSSRTLLLEDGAPTVFFAPYGDPSAHYSTPIERIERIEVLKGSGQILYGPQTMGGMINFVTRPVPTNGTAGSVKITGGNNGYYDGHFNVGSGTENGGFMVDVLKKRGDGIRAEHQFDLQDVALKGQYKISRDQRITGKYSNFQEDSLFSETGLTAAEYLVSPYRGARFDASAGANRERFTMQRNTAQVVHEWDLNSDMKLSTQFYYSQTDRTSRRSREFEIDDSTRGTGELVNTNDHANDENAFAVRPRRYEFFGIEPKLEVKHNSFGLQNQAVVGFRYHNEDIDRKKYNLIGGLFGAQEGDERLTARIKALSYYVQNTFFAGDWSFTPGLRLEDVTSKRRLYTGENFSFNNALDTSKLQALPGFGFTWNGLKTSTVFGGIHRGFAPPRPDRDILDDTLRRVTPELSTTTEVGIRSSVLQSGYIESTMFNMAISDIVVQTPDGSAFRNEGKAQHTGFEVAGKINLGELVGKNSNYFASLSYTNLFTAKFKDTGLVGGEGEDGYGSYRAGHRLPYAPKHTLALNLSYEDQQGLIGRVGVTHISQQFANTDNWRGTSPAGYCSATDLNDCGLFGEIPSLTLVNASMSYSPKGQKVTYFVSGENLSDKKYFSARTNGLQPGRGRMIFAGIRYSF
jgi:Fe(3+) dicitrate transport protein